ncbi:probable E3 ubiquitin-protein ligase RNF217 [Osmerus eperlanus]|uniref:probable E3 ubiquitin-protein ligase RNF217 n=1 Tax=Osmerus eperlanus TaxID=29151 RepID=UPI002E123912
MEDDQMSEDNYPCSMLGLVGSYEDETVYNVYKELPYKVESRGTDFAQDARDSKVQTAGGHLDMHMQRIEKRTSKENEDTDNFRRQSAVHILKRNFGTSRSFSTLNNNNNTADDQKDSDDNIVDIVIKRMESLDLEKSNWGEPEDITEQIADQTKGLTSSDLDQVDVTDSDECRSNRTDDESFQLKEHVYCTVYCIANDNYRKPPDNRESTEHQHIEKITPSTSDVTPSDLSVGLRRHSDADTGLRPTNIPEPYTLSNLIDSRSLSNFYNRDYSVSVLMTCRICLDDKHIKPLHCCKKAVCEECLKRYISSQVRVGRADIICPITECSGFLEESVVVSHLANEEVAKYHYFLELGRLDASTKPCPQCSLFTSLKTRSLQTPSRAEHKYKVQCSKCHFVWCFKCHAPWHQGLKCRDYRRGDKLLRTWASVVEHGQRNAQKCPRCKIHIQRTEGCDHMTCTQCNTNFCYRCGEKYRHLRFFGDHTSNLSVFGCKYRYLPEKPHLRRLVRGSVCVSKVVVAPVVIVLMVVIGALSLVIGLVAFPIYYICKRRRKRTHGTGRWI